MLRALLSWLAASLRGFRDGATDGHGDWDDGATQLAMPGVLGWDPYQLPSGNLLEFAIEAMAHS